MKASRQEDEGTSHDEADEIESSELEHSLSDEEKVYSSEEDEQDPDDPTDEDNENERIDHAIAPPENKKIHKLSLQKTEDFNKKLKKRGVIYMSRIPPRMTPTKVKTLLSQFGEVTRVYLTEEDAAVRKRRRKLSGNGSKRYIEGWIEFASKKVAKHVAASLNNTPITNYKRSPHYGDLWNLKYLSKFQWSHLTEKVAYERRVREQKLRLETMQARRETASYKQLVETGKKIDKIEARKRKRAERDGKDVGDDTVKKTYKPVMQVKPTEEGADKATKKALLGALV